MKQNARAIIFIGMIIVLMSVAICAAGDGFTIEVPNEIREGEDLTIKWKSVDLATSYSLNVFCYDQSIDLEWNPNVGISFGYDSEDRSWTFYGYQHTLVPGKYYVHASAKNNTTGLYIETTADFIVKSAVRSEPPQITSNQSSFNLGDEIIFSIDTNGAEKWVCLDQIGINESGMNVTETPTIWKTSADGKHSSIYQFAVRKNGIWSKIAYYELDFSFVQGSYRHLLIEHRRVEPSCTTKGYEAYWSCKACSKLFSDSNAENEISSPIIIPAIGHKLIKHDRIDATSTTTGVEEYWQCRNCGKLFSDSQGINEINEPIIIPMFSGQFVDPNGTGTYSIWADGTATYLKPTQSSSSISIPAKINGHKVVAIADNAFKGNKNLTTIIIGKNIKTIGKNSFANCVKLKTVKDGSGVVTIKDSAFSGCKNLKTFPTLKKLQSIGGNAFKSCIKLTKFTLESAVKAIGKNAFNGCKTLKTITVKTSKLTNDNMKTGAFKGIYKKATFKCPKAKLKDYKTLFVKKGAPKTCKFK